MDVGMGHGSLSKGRENSKGYNEREVVESDDLMYTERMRHIEMVV